MLPTSSTDIKRFRRIRDTSSKSERSATTGETTLAVWACCLLHTILTLSNLPPVTWLTSFFSFCACSHRLDYVRASLPPSAIAYAYAMKDAKVHLEKGLVCGQFSLSLSYTSLLPHLVYTPLLASEDVHCEQTKTELSQMLQKKLECHKITGFDHLTASDLRQTDPRFFDTVMRLRELPTFWKASHDVGKMRFSAFLSTSIRIKRVYLSDFCTTNNLDREIGDLAV